MRQVWFRLAELIYSRYYVGPFICNLAVELRDYGRITQNQYGQVMQAVKREGRRQYGTRWQEGQALWSGLNCDTTGRVARLQFCTEQIRKEAR